MKRAFHLEEDRFPETRSERVTGKKGKVGKREIEKKEKAAKVGYTESCPEEWTLRKRGSQTVQKRGHLIVK